MSVPPSGKSVIVFKYECVSYAVGSDLLPNFGIHPMKRNSFCKALKKTLVFLTSWIAISSLGCALKDSSESKSLIIQQGWATSFILASGKVSFT
jgi:hypothetical protein